MYVVEHDGGALGPYSLVGATVTGWNEFFHQSLELFDSSPLASGLLLFVSICCRSIKISWRGIERSWLGSFVARPVVDIEIMNVNKVSAMFFAAINVANQRSRPQPK